jgi:putative ABC transport system ATP-binding protein
MIKIELNNIGFSYQIGHDSFVPVLQNLNLKAESGDIIGLIGKNGSGKTTLLNILKGVLLPESGEISIFNDDAIITQKHYIPLVSQMVDSNLFPSLTVYENFCVVKGKKTSSWSLYNSKLTHKFCFDLLCSANMGLEKKLDEQVRFLSGGQKQAISILLALEYEYPILLMDEPTASLDPFVSENIIKLAKQEISKRKGILFLVSHNLQDIIKYATQIFVLSNGKVNELINSGSLSEPDLMRLM